MTKWPNSDNENGNWIATFTGKWIEPLSPDPANIDIRDIAHSLANQCRFTGHTKEFYSTAQHCVYVSYIVPREFALWGLLHDASEAYVSDIARPVKHSVSEFGAIYAEVEQRLSKAVAKAFDLSWPEPKEVKIADKMMLRAEQRDLMANDPNPGPIWEGKVEPWVPKIAEEHYLARYNSLTGKRLKVKRTGPTLREQFAQQRQRKTVGIERR